MIRDAFNTHLLDTTPQTSNRRTSYLRALDMLGEILATSNGPFSAIDDIWAQQSPTKIDQLYDYIKAQQKSGEIFVTDHPPSYQANGFYSAALGAYRDFLIEQRYATKLAKMYSIGEFNPKVVDDSIEDAELLTQEPDKLEVTEKIREVKTRVGHKAFKRELNSAYNSECCITGLNVPELNRASHIVPWKDDKSIRLDPSNGLYLSATYDAAFDRHLFTLDEDYRIVISAELKAFFSKQVCADYFERYAGTKITLPSRNPPSQEHLERHRKHLA